MRGFIDYFDDPRVVEIMLNGDKSLWIERVGEGMIDTGRRIEPVDAERFISIVSTVTQDKINKQKPYLSGELP
ncbi:MAG: Flp pilus assembly complex ATPase component TadA, partial [Anaerovibrio sp.]|nr:Flp pilus assembly complex ATPase component TadA [Anaerovibrio sp.]